MENFITYDPATGEIDAIRTGPECSLALYPNAIAITAGVDRSTHHVVDGVIAIRAEPLVPSDAELKALAMAQLNGIAHSLIINRIPDWKQRNHTARMLELMVDGQTDSAEFAAIRAEWDWVKAVRAASNAATAAIQAATTQAEIDAAVAGFNQAIS